MITLATLPQATEQEVFDQVANHLLTQNESCVEDMTCKYKSGSLSCAAGCLIAPDEYEEEEMERHSWPELCAEGVVPSDHQWLIRELQTIHDNAAPSKWRTKLEDLARNRGLVFTAKQDA